ncbi:MAG: hypothetical protein ACXQS2_03815 [Methermicoccaceae archaeon]
MVLKDKKCRHCGGEIEEDKGVFYVGRWYHKKCFKELYGKKFPNI